MILNSSPFFLKTKFVQNKVSSQLRVIADSYVVGLELAIFIKRSYQIAVTTGMDSQGFRLADCKICIINLLWNFG